MKKILASVLTAAMMLSMGTAAMADTSLTKSDPAHGTNVVLSAPGAKESLSVYITDAPTSAYEVRLLDKDGNALTTLTPMKDDYSDTSSLYGGNHWCKIIIGGDDNTSDNWYQTGWIPYDDVVPNAVAIYVGNEKVAEESLADDFSGEEWAALNYTVDSEYPGYDSGVKHFNKVYEVNAGEETPEETFKFNFEFVKYKDADGTEFEAGATGCPNAPKIDQASVNFDSLTATKMDAVPVVLNADEFPVVGVYTYKVTEVDNNIAGVTYQKTPIYLVVTILRSSENDDLDNKDGAAKYIAAIHYSEALDSSNKIGEVVNSYDSDSLAITKQVEGNLADTTEYFKVTVKFTAPTGDDDVVDLVKSPIYYTAAKDNEGKAKYNKDAIVAIDAIADAAEGWKTYPVEIWLKDGDTITFTNIPVGVTYEVVEDKPTDYEKVTYSGTDTKENSEMGSGKIDNDDTVLITNYKGATIDTGISVDSIPYIAILGVVAIGGTGFIVSKKRHSED